MEIILSTRNPSKVEQIRAIFSDLPIQVHSLEEAHIFGEVKEDGETLEENAYKKALFAWEASKQWSIADDTGLFIDALKGQPGIHAARWAGENLSTEDIMNFTLNKLNGVIFEERTAYFKTVVCVITPEGSTHFFTGEIRGTVLPKPRTACQPKMPYSAIFQPKGSEKTWSEMSVKEENEISHRGQAFKKVHSFLSDTLEFRD